MAPPRPTVEPQFAICGDTLQFDKTFSNFPASDGWALSYVLASAGGTPITDISGANVTSTGITFNINVPASVTAKWAAGEYIWTSYLTGSGTYANQRFSVQTGVITIKPDPAKITVENDPRLQAKQNLDAIEAVLAGRATADVQAYRIAGPNGEMREITKMSIKDLLAFRSYWQQRYKQARIAAGENFPSTTVGATFVPSA